MMCTREATAAKIRHARIGAKLETLRTLAQTYFARAHGWQETLRAVALPTAHETKLRNSTDSTRGGATNCA
jgi:hypothetical protein